MADTTALDRLREAHLNVVRRSAGYLAGVIADMQLALDAGRVPARRKVISAAVDLDRGLMALEVIGETAEICGGEDGDG
jgi:hypothetical protein